MRYELGFMLACVLVTGCGDDGGGGGTEGTSTGGATTSTSSSTTSGDTSSTSGETSSSSGEASSSSGESSGSSTTAASDTDTDTDGPTGCEAIRDEGACLEAGCSWIGGGQGDCLDPGDMCKGVMFEMQCNFIPGCQWSEEEMACLPGI